MRVDVTVLTKDDLVDAIAPLTPRWQRGWWRPLPAGPEGTGPREGEFFQPHKVFGHSAKPVVTKLPGLCRLAGARLAPSAVPIAPNVPVLTGRTGRFRSGAGI